MKPKKYRKEGTLNAYIILFFRNEIWIKFYLPKNKFAFSTIKYLL